jgi:hypothetical protein
MLIKAINRIDRIRGNQYKTFFIFSFYQKTANPSADGGDFCLTQPHNGTRDTLESVS